MNALEDAYEQLSRSYAMLIGKKDYDYLCLSCKENTPELTLRLYHEADPSSFTEPFYDFLIRRDMLRYAESILEEAREPFPSENKPKRFDYALCNRSEKNISSLLTETDRAFPIESDARLIRDRILKHGSDGSLFEAHEEIWLCHLGLAYENGSLNTVKYYFTSQNQELFQQLRGRVCAEYDTLLEYADLVRKDIDAVFWMVGLDTGKEGLKYKIYLRRYKDLYLPTEASYFSGRGEMSRTLFRIRDWYKKHPELWFEGTAFGLESSGRCSLNLYFARNG